MPVVPADGVAAVIDASETLGLEQLRAAHERIARVKRLKKKPTRRSPPGRTRLDPTGRTKRSWVAETSASWSVRPGLGSRRRVGRQMSRRSNCRPFSIHLWTRAHILPQERAGRFSRSTNTAASLLANRRRGWVGVHRQSLRGSEIQSESRRPVPRPVRLVAPSSRSATVRAIACNAPRHSWYRW